VQCDDLAFYTFGAARFVELIGLQLLDGLLACIARCDCRGPRRSEGSRRSEELGLREGKLDYEFA